MIVKYYHTAGPHISYPDYASVNLCYLYATPTVLRYFYS
jgi:hypothetical protein